MALERELVLFLSRDAGFLRRVLGQVAHVRVGERIPQPVANHAVHELAVPGLDAAANAVHVMRGVRHRLDPARHKALLVGRFDRLRREHHGFEAGAADLVDRHRGDRAGKSGMNGRLTRRRLPFTPLQHVAHDHFFDRVVGNRGAAHGFAYRQRAEPRPG